MLGIGIDIVVSVCLVDQKQHDEVISFYRRVHYRGGLARGDLVVGARVSGRLVGAVRLATENDLLVLRGMYVQNEFQRQGIGFGMLVELLRHLGERECWCIPYAHLHGFYSRAGFVESTLGGAPGFLVERLNTYVKSGRQVILMRRGSGDSV